jgi:nitrite reductase/ring-hydroxylating ferredoxin subunit
VDDWDASKDITQTYDDAVKVILNICLHEYAKSDYYQDRGVLKGKWLDEGLPPGM